MVGYRRRLGSAGDSQPRCCRRFENGGEALPRRSREREAPAGCCCYGCVEWVVACLPSGARQGLSKTFGALHVR